ncbi:MAG: hypothetical protein MUO52_08785, partial [Desulfobacterales bacterium]|nr:hypothetical protein [Desulfobacterales bacterium]
HPSRSTPQSVIPAKWSGAQREPGSRLVSLALKCRNPGWSESGEHIKFHTRRKDNLQSTSEIE